VLSHRLIEKSDNKVVIDKNSVYWRDSFVCGTLHEQLYLIVTAAPLYPVDYTTLYYDRDKYPAKQALEALIDKYGPEGDEKYKPPSKLRIDALDEYKPKNLEQLYEHIETLQRRVDVRAFAPNWERDFVRVKYNATCIDGDRAFFKTQAVSALDEGRVQISSTAKSLLSRDQDALICFGICVSALETLNPYKGERRSSGFEEAEARLGASYV
jgi:hypothetical protein